MTDVIIEADAERVAAPAPVHALDEQLVAQLSERARAEGLRIRLYTCAPRYFFSCPRRFWIEAMCRSAAA